MATDASSPGGTSAGEVNVVEVGIEAEAAFVFAFAFDDEGGGGEAEEIRVRPELDAEGERGVPAAWRWLSHSWCQARSCVSIVLITSRKSQSTWSPDEFVVPEYSRFVLTEVES